MFGDFAVHYVEYQRGQAMGMGARSQMAGNNDDRLLCDGVRMLIVAYRQGILDDLDEAGIWQRMAMVSPLEELATEGLILAIFGAETLRHRAPTAYADAAILADLLEAGGESAPVALAIADRVIATHQELARLAETSSTVAKTLASRMPLIPSTPGEHRAETLGTLILLTVLLRLRLARASKEVTMQAMRTAAYQHLPPRQAAWVYAMVWRAIITMNRLWVDAQAHATATRQAFWDVRETDGFRQRATATLVARGFDEFAARVMGSHLTSIDDCTSLEHAWEDQLRADGPQAAMIRSTRSSMHKLAGPFVLRYCQATVDGQDPDEVLAREFSEILPVGKRLVFDKLSYAARMTMRLVDVDGWPGLHTDGATFALALKVHGVDPLMANTLGAELRTVVPLVKERLAHAAATAGTTPDAPDAPKEPPDRMPPETPRSGGCFTALALGLGLGLAGVAGVAWWI